MPLPDTEGRAAILQAALARPEMASDLSQPQVEGILARTQGEAGAALGCLGFRL